MRLQSETYQWSYFPESYDTVEKSFDVMLNTPQLWNIPVMLYEKCQLFSALLFHNMQKAWLWGKHSVSTTIVLIFCVAQRHMYPILTFGEVIHIHSSSDNLLEFPLWLGCLLAWWYWQVNSPHYASITSSLTWR